MIDLEEEARKRRERLNSVLTGKNSNSNSDEIEKANLLKESKPKREGNVSELENEEFKVPEGEILLDSSGAEIISLDSKLPDTLEAQVKSLLTTPQTQPQEIDLNAVTDRNSDLKREYERKMTRLDRQTRRSVVDIVRKRLEMEEAAEVKEQSEQ